MQLYLALFQKIPDSVIDQALNANPWNTAAYGLLVVILMVFALLNYRDRRRSDKALIDFMTKTVGLLGRVEEKMVVLHDLKAMLKSNMNQPPPTSE